MVVLALILLGELLFLAKPLVFLSADKFLASMISGVLVDLTNENRVNHELVALTTNSLLEQAAQLKAADMANRGYFSHYGLDGTPPWN